MTGFTTLATKEWALLLTYQVILYREDGIIPQTQENGGVKATGHGAMKLVW